MMTRLVIESGAVVRMVQGDGLLPDIPVEGGTVLDLDLPEQISIDRLHWDAEVGELRILPLSIRLQPQS